MSISVGDVGSVDIFVVLLFIILMFLMFLNEEENDDDAHVKQQASTVRRGTLAILVEAHGVLLRWTGGRGIASAMPTALCTGIAALMPGPLTPWNRETTLKGLR